LCIERSAEIAVGILGILKAGGAYLPLDPRLPSARLAVMIEESGADVVVTRNALARLLPSSLRTVLLDSEEALDALPTTAPANTAEPHHLAYVLFTSGSTGKPKAVGIEHRQLASYVDAVTARLDIPSGASFATVTTFAADLGNTAIYPALTSGGALHILTEERAADPLVYEGCYTAPVALDVTARRQLATQYGINRGVFTIDQAGLDLLQGTGLGRLIRLTHRAGFGQLGWTSRILRVTGVIFNPNVSNPPEDDDLTASVEWEDVQMIVSNAAGTESSDAMARSLLTGARPPPRASASRAGRGSCPGTRPRG